MGTSFDWKGVVSLHLSQFVTSSSRSSCLITFFVTSRAKWSRVFLISHSSAIMTYLFWTVNFRQLCGLWPERSECNKRKITVKVHLFLSLFFIHVCNCFVQNLPWMSPKNYCTYSWYQANKTPHFHFLNENYVKIRKNVGF